MIKSLSQLPRAKAEGSEKQCIQPLESSYFYQCSDQMEKILSLQTLWLNAISPKPHSAAQTDTSDWIWALVSSCLIFLSLLSHVKPVSATLLLGLKSYGPRCWDHRVSSISVLHRFNLLYPRTALHSQRSVHFCLPSTGIKGLCHHCLMSMTIWWLSSALSSSGSFIC